VQSSGGKQQREFTRFRTRQAPECGMLGPEMDDEYQMIETARELRALVTRIADEPCVALDTEFVWERTYYARLGLIQLALRGGECFLVDTVALTDLAPLGAVVADSRIEKILHDAPQDLMILRRATGASARRVFDTRLAAGFAGLSCETSLQNLLADLLGVQLPKGHTRADWMARPLSGEQLQYAADDVRYLPRAAALLRDRARAAGVESWLNEELELLDASALYEERGPEESYLRIRAATSLRPRGLAVLRELAAWRESEARTADLPRRRVADDPELVCVARALPREAADLAQCRDLGPRTARRHGAQLLAAVRRGMSLPDADLPFLAPQPDARRLGQERIAAVGNSIRRCADAKRVDWRLVSNKNDVMLLLRDGHNALPENHRLLRGWRAELLGDSLAAVLRPTAP
jgi:ribonuclease D